ncbi:hypothetical protein [Aeromicrobium sp. CTD01-1L150]|uniref:hypothetical protein n=1 Tax=Aeromicrobium sp. CTD01-1L150 TaxID=3341830 RepID=UPI0035BF9237
MMRRWRVVAGALLALSLVASPSYAADELGLSHDGATWGSSLPAPLFDPALRWVPGDARTESFHIRNQAAETGGFRIRMLAVTADGLLSTGDLRVSARAGAGEWTTVDEPGTHLLLQGELAAGAQERVDVRVELDPASGNESQLRSLDLKLDARLTGELAEEDGAPAGSGEETGDAGGLLPDAGGIAFWLIIIALLAVATGAAGIARRRGDDHAQAR